MAKRKPFEFITNEKGCMLCTSHCKTRDGHVQIKVNKKVIAAHRYVYEECYGSIPKGKIIRHKCDNASCLNPEHLILGNHQDNVRDRVERKRSATGARNGRSRLTPEKVIEIRSSNLSQRQLGRIFGVDRKVIYDIQKRNTWKDVG